MKQNLKFIYKIFTRRVLWISEETTNEFKKLLIKYYETNNNSEIKKFLKEKCLLKLY